MNLRRRLVGTALAALLCGSGSGEAQQTKKIARIGFLSSQSGPQPPLAAFKDGLHDLGLVEGKQTTFEYRYGGGNAVRLFEFAKELVDLQVDVILAGPGNGPSVAAKRATTTIPIVMVAAIDPVNNGIVSSLARPEANVTGLTFEVTREQAGKNLELLKEAAPRTSRVALLRTPSSPRHLEYSKEAETAANSLKISVEFADMQAPNEKGLQHALTAAVEDRANALLVTPHPFFVDRRPQIISFAAAKNLPAMYFSSAFVVDGGLMSYAPSSLDLWRRAAVYVDRILKGAKPADLPVEQPRKFNLTINLKAAKQISLNIPPHVLARADRVIR